MYELVGILGTTEAAGAGEGSGLAVRGTRGSMAGTGLHSRDVPEGREVQCV